MGDKSNDSRISSEGVSLMDTLTGCKLEVEGSGEYGMNARALGGAEDEEGGA
jgi:hypothetical protein